MEGAASKAGSLKLSSGLKNLRFMQKAAEKSRVQELVRTAVRAIFVSESVYVVLISRSNNSSTCAQPP